MCLGVTGGVESEVGRRRIWAACYVGPFVPPYAAQIAAAWGARRIEPLGEIAALGGVPPPQALPCDGGGLA